MSPEAQQVPETQETHEQRLRRELGLMAYGLIEDFEAQSLERVGIEGYSAPKSVITEFKLKSPAEDPRQIAVGISNQEQKTGFHDTMRRLEVYKEFGRPGGNHFQVTRNIDCDGSMWRRTEGHWAEHELDMGELVTLVDILEELEKGQFDAEVVLKGGVPPF